MSSHTLFLSATPSISTGMSDELTVLTVNCQIFPRTETSVPMSEWFVAYVPFIT